MCTYENWPRSIKCSMCGNVFNSHRSQASSLIMSSPEREIDSNQDNTRLHGSPNILGSYT